jgi:hypothetical protein
MAIIINRGKLLNGCVLINNKEFNIFLKDKEICFDTEKLRTTNNCVSFLRSLKHNNKPLPEKTKKGDVLYYIIKRWGNPNTGEKYYIGDLFGNTVEDNDAVKAVKELKWSK